MNWSGMWKENVRIVNESCRFFKTYRYETLVLMGGLFIAENLVIYGGKIKGSIKGRKEAKTQKD